MQNLIHSIVLANRLSSAFDFLENQLLIECYLAADS